MDCPQGTYASLPGQSRECPKCPPGRFSTSTRLAECPPCDYGSFGNGTGASTCYDCLPGEIASLQALVACVSCTPGKYQNESHGSLCNNCEPGTFASGAALGCTLCDIGSYAQSSGLSVCVSCEAGRFSNTLGSISCTPCLGGYFQANVGQQGCNVCPSGRFSIEASVDCSLCPDGQVAVNSGQTNCTFCDVNSIPNSIRDQCICNTGYYAQSNTATLLQCQPCPSGADCTQPGVTQADMAALPGWWRTENITVFYRCLRQEHCLGGQALNSSQCEAHRVNPLCAVCAPGYHTFFGGTCQACPPKGNSTVFLVFVIIAMILLYMLMMKIILRGSQDLLNEESKRARRRAIERGVADGEDGWEQLEDEVKMSGPERRGSVVTLGTDFLITRPAEFMFKMKIMLTFLQIITNIGISLGIPWPATFQQFISFFSFANIDLIQVFVVLLNLQLLRNHFTLIVGLVWFVLSWLGLT